MSLHLDASVCPTDRATALLAEMELSEKIAQLTSAWVFEMATGPRFSNERATPLLFDGLGHITRVCGASPLNGDDAAALANDIQSHLIENTRLGIPAILHEEICSGVMARGATIYPQAIGVASTWEPELNEQLSASVRDQLRAIGATQGLSPVLDITRDPRWGRTEETYGEDPLMVSLMGVAFVKGLQGDSLQNGVIATAKHFVGYGLSEGGLNWAPAHIPERSLREVFMRPFEMAVREAGLRSVMNAYNELDGVPCGANADLLSETLRDQWGFDGIVVSDYFSIRHLDTVHHVARDGVDAAVLALNAGIDVELPTSDCYSSPLNDAVEGGLISVETIDQAVHRVLSLKFELGLFEKPYVEPERVSESVRSPSQLGLARTIAQKSMVLLKNDGLLPLDSNGLSIALIGPNAAEARHMIGDYAYPAHAESLEDLFDSALEGPGLSEPAELKPDLDGAHLPVHVTTVLDDLTQRFGQACTIEYQQGCEVQGNDTSGFEAAVQAASRNDVAVMVMGDRAGLTVESTSGESRDAASLNLPGVQEDLIEAVVATGTPVVLVLVSGRPNGSPAVHDRAGAVVMAWLPGEAGAAAILDVLFGEYNPGGKLPITYPRSSGQVPTYFGHKPSGGRSNWKGDYIDSPVSPLYPFGFGLSYTTFEQRVAQSAELTDDGETIEVVVEVSNTGAVAGDEVVQVYASIPVASVTRPMAELVGFSRLHLDPGETRALRFQIPVEILAFYNRKMELVLESGAIEVCVGANSRDTSSAGAVEVKDRHVAQRPLVGSVQVTAAAVS